MRTGSVEAEAAEGAGGYRPERQRGVALALTVLVFCLPGLLLVLLSWRSVPFSTPAAPHVAAFDVADRPREEDPAPDDPEPENPQKTESSEAVSPPQPQLPTPPVPSVVLAQSAAPSPPQKVEVQRAPAAATARPPAAKPRPSGGEPGPDTWQARVLGRLNAAKTYPASARARRQQGTVMVRFVLDRKGTVLSVSLEKSSGFAPLDREALALPKRTSPLPAPPESIAGERIELVVPVEFYF
ncbi:energy transducer TonB family protein [Novosphingobium kaempferiae]|uniref:energy transducer TonB family protein n=1 Tax=Novosphingobium kaempferiae TaxID=2896849 RepID=UPI001E419E17|nr:energy transducer TonB [Novosphingobium kaempferiae]